ncbi:MAG: enoyl-CoA hydratase/isomerase family protein [Microthrixaceae bacterium]
MSAPPTAPSSNEAHSGDLTVEQRGVVAVVTMLADSRLNAMRRSFWGSLRDVLAQLESDDSVRSIVITGDGERAFSAGGDIHGYVNLTSAPDRRDFIVDCMRTFEAVETCGKPVIAAVNGVAVGGGSELALACDVVIASDHASFAVPESGLGLVPGFGMLRLMDHLSPGWAKYLVFTGESLGVEDAARLGLVQRVVPSGQLLDEAVGLGERMARSAPMALRAGKALLNSALNTRYHSSVDAVVMLQSTEDAAEGIAAFQERRAPEFHGR